MFQVLLPTTFRDLSIMAITTLTAVVVRESEGYVATCPELDVASQGDTPEEAKSNLAEAVQLFFDHASETEVIHRTRETFVSELEVAVG